MAIRFFTYLTLAWTCHTPELCTNLPFWLGSLLDLGRCTQLDRALKYARLKVRSFEPRRVILTNSIARAWRKAIVGAPLSAGLWSQVTFLAKIPPSRRRASLEPRGRACGWPNTGHACHSRAAELPRRSPDISADGPGMITGGGWTRRALRLRSRLIRAILGCHLVTNILIFNKLTGWRL